ncbi:MAG: hypothetical protein AMXMBFR34_46950 [Myxococcaceae bacterium]
MQRRPISEPSTLAANVAFQRVQQSLDVEVGDYVVGFVGRPVELGPAAARYFVATPMEGAPVVAGLPYERMRATANRAFCLPCQPQC